VKFILMFTIDDVTVADAVERYQELGAVPVDAVGFKDIGLDFEDLATLAKLARRDGREVVFEIVSDSLEAELRSARKAVELAVDYLIGGVRVNEVLPIIDGTDIQYFPYVGTIVGHPCIVEGSVEAITRHAEDVLTAGADGVNLLAYRYSGGEASELISHVRQAVGARILVAGSVTGPRQIVELAHLGVEAFTIGGAVLQRQFARSRTLADEASAVLASIPR
jgi:hypothetical protein